MSALGSANPAPPSFNPGPADPPIDPRTQPERDAWITLDGHRFMDMCNRSLTSGNFNYVKTALQVNHEGMTNFVAARVAGAGPGNPPTVTSEETFQMLHMQLKVNAMLLTLINRASTIEQDARTLVTRVVKVEESADTAEKINKLAEAIKSGGKGPGGGKPISEYKALQILGLFKGERKEFREWNDKLLNALAQVKYDYRDAMKNLNKKLETMDGVIPSEDAEDLQRILNGRLTLNEYAQASPATQAIEDNKGDFEFTDEHMEKLDEDLWYVLNDKLVGDEPRGKLKGLSDGDGLTAYQKLYKWYSAVTGVTLSAKMSEAMNPEPPKRIKDTATRLEEWKALVGNLEKYGSAYELPLPFKVTALRRIMEHARDWFDEWQQSIYATPADLNDDKYAKLYSKCEDWARKKKLDDDTKHNNSMDVGFSGSNEHEEEWDQLGWVDEEGNWWPDEEWNDGYQQEEDVDAVNKGKGKGKSNVKCFNCGAFGHMSRDCKKPRKGKGKGGNTGGKGGKGVYRTSYNSYLKTKGSSKGQPRSWSSYSNNAQRTYVPHSDRECYKCGGKGHIAVNCPQSANGVEQAPNGAGPTMLGEPKPPHECGLVELNSDNDETTSTNSTEVPTLTSSDGEDWVKTRRDRKMASRTEAIKLKKLYQSHRCSGSCNHSNTKGAPFKQANISWAQKCAEVGLVEAVNDTREVNAVPKGDSNTEVITVTVDSGAYNTVGPPKTGTHFTLKPTTASATGKHYRAANGTIIQNYGQRVVTGVNDNGLKIGLPIQIADVNKVLGSVREMVESGNRVTFDRDDNGKPCSYVEHKASGKRTDIHERNGTFQFDIRVPKGNGMDITKVQEVAEEANDEGFTRPGTLEADLFY